MNAIRRPRESIVGVEFRNAVEELNLSIPLEKQIRYFALDYTRASKGHTHVHMPTYVSTCSLIYVHTYTHAHTLSLSSTHSHIYTHIF